MNKAIYHKGDIVICAHIDKSTNGIVIDKIPYKIVSEREETEPFWIKQGYPYKGGYCCVPLYKVGSSDEGDTARHIAENFLYKVSKAKEFSELQAELEKNSATLYNYTHHSYLQPNAVIELLEDYDFKAKATRLQQLYKEIAEELSTMMICP